MAASFASTTSAFPNLKDIFPIAAPAFSTGMDSGEVDPVLAEREASRREDEGLVARAQAGDSTAFDSLVVKHSPRLYSQMYHMTSNHDDANDMLQDVWMKAYRNITGFRGKSAFSTWLHSIASNTAINFVQKRGRRKTMSLDDVDNGIANDKEFTELVAQSTPMRDADLGEMQEKINEAMLKLSPDHRAVVTMFDIQGMAHSEIAEILKLSEGTVRSRLFYAHKQLQAWLSEFAPNPTN
jgi:RNA polymerase sigma factor (sigma-70 family)